MKIALIGATGYVGSALLTELLARGTRLRLGSPSRQISKSSWLKSS